MQITHRTFVSLFQVKPPRLTKTLSDVIGDDSFYDSDDDEEDVSVYTGTAYECAFSIAANSSASLTLCVVHIVFLSHFHN